MFTLKPGETITYTQSAVSLESILGKYIFSGKDEKSGEQPETKSDEANLKKQTNNLTDKAA